MGEGATPTPARRTPNRWGTLAALGGVLFGAAYLLNPGAGIFELIPDGLPLIGNLDEAGATAMLIFGLRHVGQRMRSRGRSA